MVVSVVTSDLTGGAVKLIVSCFEHMLLAIKFVGAPDTSASVVNAIPSDIGDEPPALFAITAKV